MTPLPGIHHGVSFEDYQQWQAINFSRLKPIRQTASKCRWEMDHPKKPTPAMILGSALHVATLEPGRFDQLFYICPPCDRRTAEGKEVFAKAEQSAQGRLLIRSGSKEDEALMSQLTELRGMAAAIHASRAAQPFLQAAGQNEVSLLWLDKETGLTCKARCDRLIESFAPWGCPVVLEIKSTRCADDWEFGRDCQKLGYAAQAGCYRTGYQAITGVWPAHVIVAVESLPPHDLKVHMLDDQSLQTGASQYRQMLSRYAECLAFDSWPGYPDVVSTLSLPNWANEMDYEEVA